MAKRDYDNSYPSVTTILGCLRKIGLEQWFLSNTRAYCTEKSNKGKIIGTQIHEAIQSYIETGSAKVSTEYDEEVTNALKSFMLFRKEDPLIIPRKAEIALTSELHKFNGTIDCLADGIMLDWKTGEVKSQVFPKIYDEWKYQIAAYVYLYNETQGTNINRAMIVAIAKDKVAYNVHEMDKEEIDHWFNEVFLPALRIYNGMKRKDFTYAPSR